jgi:enamine deaminase RidA (YjgF/YER057c/UK114 family)
MGVRSPASSRAIGKASGLTMKPSERIRQRAIVLPNPVAPRHKYVAVAIAQSTAYVSGSTPMIDGELQMHGLVGSDIDLDEARKAARICVLNCVAQLARAVDGLDNIGRILRLTGYVASAPGFHEQARVVDAASELLEEVFGENGLHARTSIGVASLPGNAPVEIDLIATVTTRST